MIRLIATCAYTMILLCVASQAAEQPQNAKPNPELRGVLASGKTELDRLNAAKALDAMIPSNPMTRVLGDWTAAAVPAPIKAGDDEEWWVRDSAILALSRINVLAVKAERDGGCIDLGILGVKRP